jgi:hypothetical protein
LLYSERWVGIILVLLIWLYLLPLGWILVPPTQDGPSHVSIANTLTHLLLHDRPALEKYFEINWFPEPNLLGHVLLSFLLTGVSPFTAEKILFGICVAALPLAALYAIRSVNSHAPSWLTLLLVPFAWSKLMQVGFYNFCLSLAVFYVCLGYFLRIFNRLNARRAATLGLLTVLLYFTHAMSVAAFFLVMLFLVPWLVFTAAKHEAAGMRKQLPRLALLLTAWLPTVILLLVFLFRSRGNAVTYMVSFAERIGRLAILSSLVTHRQVEIFSSVCLLLFLAVLTITFAAPRLRSFQPRTSDVFLLLTGVFLVVFFAIPDYCSGGSAHTQRAEMYPFLLLPLWFADQPPLVGIKRGAAIVIAAAVPVFFWVLNVTQMHKIDTAVREYYSVAPYIRPDKTVLPIVLDRYGRDTEGRPLSMRCEIFYQAADRLNPIDGAIELLNYQASSPGFIVRFKKDVPNWTLMRPNQMWNRFGAELRAGKLSGNPDYVLVYGWDPERIRLNPAFRNFSPEEVLSTLERRYVLEYISTPQQAVRLYRRRDSALARVIAAD